MAHLPVVQYTVPSIRSRSAEVPINEISAGLHKKLLRDMCDTMQAENGIGIAAPQVGVNIRAIIISTKDGPLKVFNPKIIRHSIRRETSEEGCLSVKGIFGPVPRYRSIHVRGYDEHGQLFDHQAKGMLARVFQHEIDHLNGSLFIDRAKAITQGLFDLKKWRRPV